MGAGGEKGCCFDRNGESGHEFISGKKSYTQWDRGRYSKLQQGGSVGHSIFFGVIRQLIEILNDIIKEYSWQFV